MKFYWTVDSSIVNKFLKFGNEHFTWSTCWSKPYDKNDVKLVEQIRYIKIQSNRFSIIIKRNLKFRANKRNLKH